MPTFGWCYYSLRVRVRVCVRVSGIVIFSEQSVVKVVIKFIIVWVHDFKSRTFIVLVALRGRVAHGNFIPSVTTGSILCRLDPSLAAGDLRNAQTLQVTVRAIE